MDPKDANSFHGLGLTDFILGRFTQATNDFAHQIQIDNKNDYAVLWWEISAAKIGKGKEDLLNHSTDLDLSNWPGPLIRLYLGKTTQQRVRALANDAKETAVRVDQNCEAAFFIGEQLLSTDIGAAKPLLQEAASRCRLKDYGYVAAQEMKRLLH